MHLRKTNKNGGPLKSSVFQSDCPVFTNRGLGGFSFPTTTLTWWGGFRGDPGSTGLARHQNPVVTKNLT